MDYPGMSMRLLPTVALRGLVLLLVMAVWCLPVWGAESKRAGVGLQVVPTVTGELVVLGVLDKSPAQTAGLLPGDLLVAIDGVRLQGSKFEAVVKKYLWGKPGSKVRITYLRPGVAGEQQLQLTRGVLQKNAKQRLEIKMLEPDSSEPQGTTDHGN